MALTISQVGSNNSATSTATLAVTAVTAAVGDWLVVMVAADNAGTNGAASLSSVTDSAGNSYTMTSSTYDPGAASAGATFGLFHARTTATLTGGTVTANFSPNTTAKAMVIYKVVPGANEVVAFDRVGAGYTGTTKSITATAVTNGYTIFAGMAVETNAAVTADTDTTNGSWASQYTAVGNTGTSTTSQRVCGQYKTVTATGDQTFNTATSGDGAVNWLTLYPAPAGLLGYWGMTGVTQ